MLSKFCILLAVAALHCCSPVDTLNAVAPRDGFVLTRGVAYAEGPRHSLDVYAPAEHGHPLPVLVFLYGGGWETGEKEMYRFVGAALAARGILVIVPDYRLHPSVQFPAFVQDAAAAVAWAHHNAVRFGGDPHRLFLMGHSAGAQIATLLALDPAYLRARSLSPERDVCGVIGLAGPYDFLPNADPGVQAVFGPKANWPRSQPVNYVSADAPRMLLLAGAADGTIDPGNTTRLAARLIEVGARVRAELYPEISHRAIIAAFGEPLSFLAPVREETLRFVSARSSCGPAVTAQVLQDSR